MKLLVFHGTIGSQWICVVNLADFNDLAWIWVVNLGDFGDLAWIWVVNLADFGDLASIWVVILFISVIWRGFKW